MPQDPQAHLTHSPPHAVAPPADDGGTGAAAPPVAPEKSG